MLKGTEIPAGCSLLGVTVPGLLLSWGTTLLQGPDRGTFLSAVPLCGELTKPLPSAGLGSPSFPHGAGAWPALHSEPQAEERWDAASQGPCCLHPHPTLGTSGSESKGILCPHSAVPPEPAHPLLPRSISFLPPCPLHHAPLQLTLHLPPAALCAWLPYCHSHHGALAVPAGHRSQLLSQQ